MNSSTISPVPTIEQPMPWLLLGVRILHLVVYLVLPVALVVMSICMFFEMRAIHYVAPEPMMHF